jgi:hypothetical protein
MALEAVKLYLLFNVLYFFLYSHSRTRAVQFVYQREMLLKISSPARHLQGWSKISRRNKIITKDKASLEETVKATELIKKN